MFLISNTSFLSYLTLPSTHLHFNIHIDTSHIRSTPAAPPSSSGSPIYASTLSTDGCTGPLSTSVSTSHTTNGSFPLHSHLTPSTHSMAISNPSHTISSSTSSLYINIPIWGYSALSIYGLYSFMIQI